MPYKAPNGKDRIEIRCIPEDTEKLTEYAEEMGVTVQSYINIVLKRHIKEREAKK